MSAAYWRAHSLKAIEEALATLPPDAGEKAKRKAISAAYPFHMRKYYPYKIWLAEVAKYFAPPMRRKMPTSDLRRIEEYERIMGRRFPAQEHP